MTRITKYLLNPTCSANSCAAVHDDRAPVLRVAARALLDEGEDGQGVRGHAVVGPGRVVVLEDLALAAQSLLAL